MKGIALLGILLQGATIASRDAGAHVGETRTVRGVVRAVFVSRAGNVFLNFDRPYPNQTFQAVVFRTAAGAFHELERFEGQEVLVDGLIRLYQGKPEIVLESPAQIRLVGEPPSIAGGSLGEGPSQPVRATRRCVVAIVYDGDTIGCDRLGKVRLIGIDAPEHDQEPFGAAARRALASVLTRGDTVRLEADVEPRDAYDRQLAYVWKGATLVNWSLVSQGWAVQFTVAPNVQYADWFTDAEGRARAARRGLWATNGFDCRPADHRAHRCD